MEFLDFQLDLLQIPSDLKTSLSAKFSCLGEICKADAKSIPEVWSFGVANLDRAMQEFGLKLSMDTLSWVAPDERKVRPVDPEDVAKILYIGLSSDKNLIRLALSTNSSVNTAVRWLIENEQLEKTRDEILKKREGNNAADVERAWNPGHGIISEGNANVKFLRREGRASPKRQVWAPQNRYRSVLSSKVKVSKEGIPAAPCEHLIQPPVEVQREGRSREESESGEDVELISAPSVPVREGLDGSDYSSEKEEEFGIQMVKDLVEENEDLDEGVPEKNLGVIGERMKESKSEAGTDVEKEEPSIEPLVPSQPPQPMKSLMAHNNSYISTGPAHRPWPMNGHHHMDQKPPVCSFNIRPKSRSAAHLSRMQRMQHMEFLRLQQHRRRTMEHYEFQHPGFIPQQLLRAELMQRESEAPMMFEELRRQETMRAQFDMGAHGGYDRRRYDPAWGVNTRYETALRRHAQSNRPANKSRRAYYNAQLKGDAGAHWQGHLSYNRSTPHMVPQHAQANPVAAEEVRAFGRQTILENLDFSHPHASMDPRSNRAENLVYFPDQAEKPAKATFSKAPGGEVRAKPDACYVVTPSPPPAMFLAQASESNQHIVNKMFAQQQETQDSSKKAFNSGKKLVESNGSHAPKPWHALTSVKPETSKLTSESSGSSSSPNPKESKPSQSASPERLNMDTFIKSLNTPKAPKKEEPLNNDQLNFWQKLVKTTKETERENVENFFKMFQNSSPNRNDDDISEPDEEDFDDFNQVDLMKELPFLNADPPDLIISTTEEATAAESEPKDDPAAAFFGSLLQRSKETISNISTSNDEYDSEDSENEEEDDGDLDDDEEEDEGSDLDVQEEGNTEDTSEYVEESDDEIGAEKSESPVRETLEPPNYIEQLDNPLGARADVAPEEQNEVTVNDDEFLAPLVQTNAERDSWQNEQQLQTNPEVETNTNLERRQLEDLLTHQHDEAKEEELDNLGTLENEIDLVHREVSNQEEASPPLLSEKTSTPFFENAI